ncbi:hypothetical protein, partial [Pseudoxanthomonas taiwanensis]
MPPRGRSPSCHSAPAGAGAADRARPPLRLAGLLLALHAALAAAANPPPDAGQLQRQAERTLAPPAAPPPPAD